MSNTIQAEDHFATLEASMAAGGVARVSKSFRRFAQEQRYSAMCREGL
jgi:hypothetical protein